MGRLLRNRWTGGATSKSVADIFAGGQLVLHPGEGTRPTISVNYFHRIYNGGAPELDFGSPLNTLTLLASGDVKGFHYDANALLLELTQPPVWRAQFGQTLTISQPFLRSNAVGNLWAVGYTAGKTPVFDAGLDHGLTNTSTRWEAFVGFTYLLPHRLW